MKIKTPFIAICVLISCNAVAAPSSNYYDSVDTSSSAALKQSLHDIIDDHTRIPYTSTAIDTWDIINSADEDPLNSGNVLTINKNASYPKLQVATTTTTESTRGQRATAFPMT